MTKVFVQLAFAALGLAVVRAHGGAEGQEVEFAFRQMFEVEAGQVHQLVILHQEDHEEGHVIMLSTPNCHESELAAVDPHELEERELDELVPGPALVQTSDLGGFSFETDHLGMYLFNLNLSSTCWIVLHSDASKVFLMESSTGEQVHPMFDLELKAEPVQNTAEVSGQVAGAVMLVCCLPIILVAIFYLGVSAVSSLINFGLAALFMQSFGCGALLSVTVFHVYPEMVSALEENNVPQWQGGALILGSICVLILVQLVSSKFHDHNHMKHANHETDVDESEPKHVPGAVAEGNEDVEAPSSKEIVDPAAVEKPSHGHSHHGHSHSHSFQQTPSEHPAVPKKIQLGTIRGIFDLSTIPQVVWGLTIGDSIHNLVDGAAIASAFMMCGTSSGWIVTAAIIAHEVPQELGDLVVMVAQGSTLLQACFFNFIAQLTALIGMGIVLGVGELGPVDSALLLAFGIGTFLFIALTNIMPKLVVVHTAGQVAAMCSGLVLSCVVIGLTLMLEEGC